MDTTRKRTFAEMTDGEGAQGAAEADCKLKSSGGKTVGAVLQKLRGLRCVATFRALATANVFARLISM